MSADSSPPATRAAGFGLRLALFYAAFLVVTGIQVPFFPLWLKSKDLDPQKIGFILAAPIFVRLIAVPFISRAADRHGGLATAIFLSCIASTALFAFVGIVSGFAALLLMVALFAVAFTPLGALVDAYAQKGTSRRGAHYGPVRLWGSVAFAAANLGSGLLLNVIAVEHLNWVIVAGLAVMGVFAFLLLPLEDDEPLQREKSSQASRHLWLSPRFVVVALAATLIQSSHAIYYGFSALDWKSKGFASGTVGVLWALGVTAEVVLFAVSGRFQSRPLLLIGLGGAGAAVRWIGMILNPPLFLLPPLQLLHAFSFGATHLGAVQFAAQSARARQAATAQADFGTILALGATITTASSGFLYGALGDNAYFIMAAMAVLGGILLLLARRIQEKH